MLVGRRGGAGRTGQVGGAWQAAWQFGSVRGAEVAATSRQVPCPATLATRRHGTALTGVGGELDVCGVDYQAAVGILPGHQGA